MDKITKFYKNKKILVTGHTGFKGRWLIIILEFLGAKIVGVSKNDINKKFLKFFSKKTKNYFLDINNNGQAILEIESDEQLVNYDGEIKFS